MRPGRIAPAVVVLLVLAGEMAASATLERGRFRVAGTDLDRGTAADILAVLEAQDALIRERLCIAYTSTVIVDIYPSQAAYDAAVMNPALTGTPAVSGRGRMQLVSPRARIAQDWIPYPRRLRFASHELVHLYLDELAVDLPDWLEEGTAAFLGDEEFLPWVLPRILASGTAVPSIADLRARYREIPAADQFAGALAGYLIERYGYPVFRDILNAGSITAISPWTSEEALNGDWIQYAETRYSNFR